MYQFEFIYKGEIAFSKNYDTSKSSYEYLKKDFIRVVMSRIHLRRILLKEECSIRVYKYEVLVEVFSVKSIKN